MEEYKHIAVQAFCYNNNNTIITVSFSPLTPKVPHNEVRMFTLSLNAVKKITMQS